MKRGLIVLTIVLLIGSLCPANADKTDDMAQLKQQLLKQQKMIEEQNQLIMKMMSRIDQLESQQQKTTQVIDEKVTKAVDAKKIEAMPKGFDWVKNLKISGDLRYRHESIDAEQSNHHWKDGRNRNRIRARLMVKAMINGDWDVVLRLATGSSDPVSTNQTLDEGFSTKDFRLDLAYFHWHPQAWPNLDVFGGKMKFPFYKVGKNELIWDGDLTPEGVAANYVFDLKNNNTLHLNGGAFWAEESSSSADQSLWGIQGYLKHLFEDKSYLLGGASFYSYGNVRSGTTIYDSQNGFGNTTYEITSDDPNTLCCDETKLGYVSDYDLLELFAEYGSKINGMPYKIFGNYVKNTIAATDEDTAWLIGAALNKAKDPGSWQARYNYREVNADAVLGVFSDSDFIGGGTGGKGHEFGFDYQLTKRLRAGLTYFLNERGDDNDYRRLQADLIFKF